MSSGQQRNTVKETAVETTAQGGTRCTIHPYSVSLSALLRLEILAALLSVDGTSSLLALAKESAGRNEGGHEGRKINGCEARRPEDFSGY